MPNRYYSSTAGAMTLTAGIAAGDTSISVSSVTGLPTSYPYTLVLDAGAGAEEIVDVTNASGTTLTVARAKDGTSAQSHSSGATVRHMATARDLREPQDHIAASQNVHGLGASSSVVGTLDTQTLQNKTAQASAAGVQALVVKGAASQTADVLQFQNSSGTVVAGVNLTAEGTVYTDTAKVNASGAASLYGYVARLIANAAAVVGLIVRGSASQTADLQQWQNSAGTALAKVDKDGKLTAAQVTSSADVSGTTGTFSGAITSPTITTLTAADTALDARLDVLEASQHGRTTVSTDSQGNINIAHALGVNPSFSVGSVEISGVPALCTPYNTNTTSTNLAFVIWKLDGTRLASTSVTVRWHAKA